MKPYINSGSLRTEKKEFNHHLSHARIIAEHAFGLIKGRWRCLRTRLAVSVIEVPELASYMERGLVLSGLKTASMTPPMILHQVSLQWW